MGSTAVWHLLFFSIDDFHWQCSLPTRVVGCNERSVDNRGRTQSVTSKEEFVCLPVGLVEASLIVFLSKQPFTTCIQCGYTNIIKELLEDGGTSVHIGICIFDDDAEEGIERPTSHLLLAPAAGPLIVQYQQRLPDLINWLSRE